MEAYLAVKDKVFKTPQDLFQFAWSDLAIKILIFSDMRRIW